MYLEPWHADIMAFLDLKKNHGNELERARDLFYAMWVPDLFMQVRVWASPCGTRSWEYHVRVEVSAPTLAGDSLPTPVVRWSMNQDNGSEPLHLPVCRPGAEQRVESDGDWNLFCPNEAPGLSDTHSEEFKVRQIKRQR